MKKLLFILFTVVLASCNGDEEVQNKYSSYQARFSYSPVATCPSLQRACTGMGEFCIIDRPLDQQQRIRVRDNHGKDPDWISRTALQNYTSIVLGIGGALIIGLPNLAELGMDQPVVICFDGVCPNCYTDSHITKQVVIKEGQATCAACQRTYDLNSQGMVTSEQGGHSLYRYAVGFNGTGVYVSNN
jgi:hypothetical protein